MRIIDRVFGAGVYPLWKVPPKPVWLWFFVGLVFGPVLLVLWLWIIVRRVRRARAEREARADSVRGPRLGR